MFISARSTLKDTSKIMSGHPALRSNGHVKLTLMSFPEGRRRLLVWSDIKALHFLPISTPSSNTCTVSTCYSNFPKSFVDLKKIIITHLSIFHAVKNKSLMRISVLEYLIFLSKLSSGSVRASYRTGVQGGLVGCATDLGCQEFIHPCVHVRMHVHTRLCIHTYIST